MQEELYMQRALELALQAEGDTSPNPIVGCVLTDAAGNIIGEGWHHKAGEPHAEIMALRDAAVRKQAALLHTAYVTLEPCSHFGRTGPCCDALIAAGVKRVVTAIEDPNPIVAGRGLSRLRAAGVEIKVGVCSEQARQINEKFFYWITKGQTFVSLKYAMTLDGKIATAGRDSKWITGEEARSYGHYLRKTHDAVLVGIGTILEDDSELTVRMVKGRNPLRIVLDTKGRIPLTARVLQGGATIVAVGTEATAAKKELLSTLPGVEVLELPSDNGHIDLLSLLDYLTVRGVTSLLVEGGSEILGAFLDAGLFNKVYAFIAPKLLGGQAALSPMGGKGAEVVSACVNLQTTEIKKLGKDTLLIAAAERT